MHLERSGRQCPAEAREGSEFCPDHTPLLDPELELESHSRRPLIYRLAALALLLIFLYNAYQTVLGWLGG